MIYFSWNILLEGNPAVDIHTRAFWKKKLIDSGVMCAGIVERVLGEIPGGISKYMPAWITINMEWFLEKFQEKTCEFLKKKS